MRIGAPCVIQQQYEKTRYHHHAGPRAVEKEKDDAPKKIQHELAHKKAGDHLIIRSLALPYEPDGNAHQNIQQNPHNRDDQTGGRKNRFVLLRIP